MLSKYPGSSGMLIRIDGQQTEKTINEIIFLLQLVNGTVHDEELPGTDATKSIVLTIDQVETVLTKVWLMRWPK
jgi:hypothetical protein